MPTEEFIQIQSTDTLFGMRVGEVTLKVHARGQCAGQFCCVHHPSQHHMITWPQLWRADRGLMERTCPHGVGHPDPDDASLSRTHGCDGCCTPEVTR